jgi:hypothetical protein
VGTWGSVLGMGTAYAAIGGVTWLFWHTTRHLRPPRPTRAERRAARAKKPVDTRLGRW